MTISIKFNIIIVVAIIPFSITYTKYQLHYAAVAIAIRYIMISV